MSHFTVMVAGNNFEELLAPYHEFECTGINDKYVQDVDITDEIREAVKGGESLEEALEDRGIGPYRTIQDESELDRDETHKYGYAIVKNGELIKAVDRTNPNAKWDWYKVGGRWSGFLKVKPEFIDANEVTIGSPGLMTEPAKAGRADQALKKHIDVEGMRAEAVEKAAEYFDHFAPAFQDARIPSWNEIRDAHPVIAAMRALQDKDFYLPWSGDWREHFHDGDRDKFLKDARDNALATYAVIDHEGWKQKGEMGWFGMSSNENDNWTEQFNLWFDNLPDDTLISIADCHI